MILIDEAADLLSRTPSLGHVILDEAQDLSPMMLRAVGRRASTGSVTVLGDLAQATTPWATRSWAESLHHLGHPEAVLEELVAGFRVPGAVIDFAARLLPSIAPAPDPAALGPPAPRRAGSAVDRPDRGHADRGDRDGLTNEGTIGVIVADAAVTRVRRAMEAAGSATTCWARTSRSSTPGSTWSRPSLAKGLEFDHVVLLEPADIVAGEPDEVTGLRRLYVCLTRAVTSLVVVHAAELPAALAA